MFQHSADDLYSIILSNTYDTDYKCRIITELKAHIKRDFVDLSQVPRYFEALKIANKSLEFKLSSLAFSSVCHLVKRVGMQDPNSLRNSSKTVLPILVNRLLDPKANFQAQAKSTLETFWLATPTIVENYIRDNALIHSNQRIRSESIIFLSNLIELNKNFNFPSFLPNLVNLIRDDSTEVVKNVEVLLLKYYTLNKSKIQDLVNELKGQKIETRKGQQLLVELDPSIARSYSVETRKPTIDSYSNLAKHKRSLSQLSSVPNVKRSVSTSSLSSSKELSDLLSKIPSAKLDESVAPVSVSSGTELSKEVEALLAPFEGKETEFNWNQRENNIVRFRALIIGNSEQLPDELIQATRTMTDGIFKSISSLRTTLSSNGCQLVKELAAYLAKVIDPIAESLFQPLASLTSATKKIASLNAFGSLCVLLINTSFNNKLFNHCFSLFQEKNIQPRLYSSTFLQIYLLKHGSKLDQYNLETVTKWVLKGVAEPNVTVRESMRITYWILYRKFPEVAAKIHSKLDLSAKKALDRSKPKDVVAIETRGTVQPEKKRQSIREFVAAQKRDRRSTSGPPQLTSTEPMREPDQPSTTFSELGRPTRIGVPQRVNRSSSAGNSYPSQLSQQQTLPRQPSKGSLRHERWSTGSRENTVEIKKTGENDEAINHLKVLLKSPLTRERVEGIQTLKNMLDSDTAIPDLSSPLTNLIILDSSLLKPLLSIPRFYELLDITLSIEVLAVNKENLQPLLEKFEGGKIVEGLISLIKSLESLKFDSAPSTMFHIKYKNLFLDYAIQNLYRIASERSDSFSVELLRDICASSFPLSISDYPRYDELIVQLYTLNQSVFLEILESSSAYVKSKINSIIEEFKDDIKDRSMENFTEHGLNEMTMINPMNRKPSDPTTSIKPGFSTDMTMIIPKVKVSETNDRDGQTLDVKNDIELENVEDSMDVDKKIVLKQPEDEDVQVDYMSDIFSRGPSRDQTEKIEIKEDREDSSPEPEEAKTFPTLIAHTTESPFLDKHEDSIVHPLTDDATRNLTNKICEIHISPQKRDSTPFKSPGRESLTNLIDQSDPIFNKSKKRIEIFQDAPSGLASPVDKKLFDLERSRYDTVLKASHFDVHVDSILELLEKFRADKISNKEMNDLIKSLHLAISNNDLLTWIGDGGFSSIISSLIHYFNVSVNITKELCFKGLIVFKELFIVNEYLQDVITLKEILNVWNILMMVVENLRDFKNEIYVSVDELVDDMIELKLPNIRFEIMKSCCNSLRELSESNTLLTSFLLLTLTKTIEKESLASPEIKEIDSVVFKFLCNDQVEIRRLTIIVYSKCKKSLSESNKVKTEEEEKFRFEIRNDNDNNNDDDIYNDVFDKLSPPQRKLVDYYCDY